VLVYLLWMAVYGLISVILMGCLKVKYYGCYSLDLNGCYDHVLRLPLSTKLYMNLY